MIKALKPDDILTVDRQPTVSTPTSRLISSDPLAEGTHIEVPSCERCARCMLDCTFFLFCGYSMLEIM